ncbi:hypothetical protein CCR75_009463 [Bremia lactucae]|uniref:Uncharacterized protein n=1 Tax=Bremia lactucae TaxID=4779 RepID=A0A976FMJ7_BRELC|nr:hypothetical protein CCR75_009463 [Bremia lactucae]
MASINQNGTSDLTFLSNKLVTLILRLNHAFTGEYIIERHLCQSWTLMM